MFQIGERACWWDDESIQGVILDSRPDKSCIKWDRHGIQVWENSYLRKLGGVKEIAITINPPVKHGWKDTSDGSTYANIRPGIHAACYYTDDGSCWEWIITTKATGADIVKSGRSIDRVTAKSDAEFFITNYQPEDTSERDEIRRKLERSWHK